MQATYPFSFAPLKSNWGGTVMTILDSQRGRVIDVNGGGMVRLIALGIIGLVLIILLFNSITRVGTGHVGVLTLFGRVTGETLGEGDRKSTRLNSSHSQISYAVF